MRIAIPRLLGTNSFLKLLQDCRDEKLIAEDNLNRGQLYSC